MPLSKFNPYLKYSTFGLQMVATILIMAFLGQWLDHYFEIKKPILTLVLMLSGVAISVYNLIKNLK
jgi:F0F1-type ATP synthase assembly protein I